VEIECLPNRGKPNRKLSHIGVGAPINKAEVRNMAESGKVTAISRPRDDGTTEIIELDHPRSTNVK
jgi:hypothetical protein